MATFDLLAELRVAIDGYRLEPLDAVISPEFTRRCTVVHLEGGGFTGVGEDVVYDGEAQVEFQKAGMLHDFSGEWSVADVCDRIEDCDLFPSPPTSAVYRLYRLWAFHSAVLDLALQQHGLTLSEALRREPRPMRYVASTRLGEPPTLEAVTKRLSLDPTLRFKLDATSSWTPELIAALVETNAVDSIDFKGMYHGSTVDQPADPVLYRRVAEAFPRAWLEDPDLSQREAAAALADAHDRITWDVPIHSVSDIELLPFKPTMVNIKPSRVGSLKRLCEVYDYCARSDIGAYGGGQTELGPGRGQAQYLAALFHPDTPNDLAPAAYNQPNPPSGLPRSPLRASLDEPGFRWT